MWIMAAVTISKDATMILGRRCTDMKLIWALRTNRGPPDTARTAGRLRISVP
jgi:hypothetical protein